MKKRFPWFAVLLLVGATWLAYDRWTYRPVKQPEGILAPDQPLQRKVRDVEAFPFEGYRIDPVAEFSLTARVLSRKRYLLAKASDICPVDLALGWAWMSNSKILKQIKITQGRRFYFWRTARFPIPKKEIEANSANMHMIPSTPKIMERVKQVRRGQVVRLKGWLVNVTDKDGRTWRTSTTRVDTGAGACEIIWLKEFEIVQQAAGRLSR